MNTNVPDAQNELAEILCQLTTCLKKHVLAGLKADRDLVDDNLEEVKAQNLTLALTYNLGPFSGELDYDPSTGQIKYW